MVTRVLVDFFEEYDERRRVSDYYYAMRFAPPSPNHPPPRTPEPAFNPATTLNEDVEKSMMQKLIEDGEDELEKEETAEQENNDGPLSDGEFEAFSLAVDPSLVPDSDSDDGLVIPESPTHSSPTTGAYDLAFIDGMGDMSCVFLQVT